MNTLLYIYLIGCMIAFVIELFTMLRIRDFCIWAWMRAVTGTVASWFWVLFFAYWVYDMMGWDYKLPTNPYSMMAWRLRQSMCRCKIPDPLPEQSPARRGKGIQLRCQKCGYLIY